MLAEVPVRSGQSISRRKPTVTERVTVDTTVYPVEEKVGEDILQRWIAELLRPLIEQYIAGKKVRAFTGADQFIYFRRGDIRRRVAPDVFVLPGVRPDRRVTSWKTWEEGIVPSLAIEVVSKDVDKDYIDGPELYRELGVQELIVFDPDHEEEPDRIRFQVWRQVGRRGLQRVLATNEDRVQSKVLGCFLRAVGSSETIRLRLGLGPEGEMLVPTEAERERAEREREAADKERDRASWERERADREAARGDEEHAARLAAEEELARLRAQLEARRRPRRPKPGRR
ncbi:MAG: Uma2 family endonuclease [Deltaproteobacteria bacterium]|nr:Uma2 family endonuclease [Deltaproteobacteria bacterium]